MLRFTHKTGAEPAFVLTLNYEQRQKSRQRVTLDNGVEAGLFLERGAILREGDCLATDDGHRQGQPTRCIGQFPARAGFRSLRCFYRQRQGTQRQHGNLAA